MSSNVQVMELPDNLKVRKDHAAGTAPLEQAAPDSAANDETARIDDEESQMRKALGLLGEMPRHRPESERTEPAHRVAERFGSGLHRRRFVQDGDVPVTVLRREQGHEAPPQRIVNPAVAPTSNRLQRLEASLAAETAAREKAERALAEAHAVVRDLQTKIGHAELARNEAAEALQREREAIATLRQDAHAWEDRVQEALARARDTEQALQAVQDQLAEEQRARRSAEKALRTAEAGRDSAAHPAPILADALMENEEWVPPLQQRRVSEHAAISPAIRRRRAAEPSILDQEPVKWWLNAKLPGRKR
jgi:hypothetical protein